MKIHGLIIDPQISFSWPGLQELTGKNPDDILPPEVRPHMGDMYDRLLNRGELYVDGAHEDMLRLAAMLDRLRDRLDDVHVTLDSHRFVDQAHPSWWRRTSDGSPPPHYTILGINNDRVVRMDPQSDGSLVPTGDEFTTRIPSFMYKGGPTKKGSKGYLEALASNGRYPHVVWPVHCMIGTMGHLVHPAVMAALLRWEEQFCSVDYVTKGSNPQTEHYSGVQAEVVDPSDPSTQINMELIRTLEEADIVFLAGEARSHCLANTARDIVAKFSDPSYVKKLYLIEDCTSDVPGFEHLGEKFVQDMVGLGMNVSNSLDFLA